MFYFFTLENKKNKRIKFDVVEKNATFINKIYFIMELIDLDILSAKSETQKDFFS